MSVSHPDDRDPGTCNNGMKLNEPAPLLLPIEVARLFNVDPKTVTRWAKDGKLTFMRTIGGHRRYFRDEVNKLFADSIEVRKCPNGH